MGESDVEIFEEEGVLFVEVALPGIRLEDLAIDTEGCRLRIRARREAPGPRRRYRLGGHRGPAAVERDLTLPPEADLEQASASLDRGILRIRVPLAVEPEPGHRVVPVDESGEG